MPGLGEGGRMLHGFTVPYLPDQDDIGCLVQRVFQRIFVAFGVDTDLALVDDGTLAVVNKLDRILASNDVTGTVGVAIINE